MGISVRGGGGKSPNWGEMTREDEEKRTITDYSVFDEIDFRNWCSQRYEISLRLITEQQKRHSSSFNRAAAAARGWNNKNIESLNFISPKLENESRGYSWAIIG